MSREGDRHSSRSVGYDHAVDKLDQFGGAVVSLITELLHEADIPTHSVTFRVKSRESASKKLAGDNEKYTGYADLTDLLGVRVITYFSDQVDRAADFLIPEFEIDHENSVDKRAALDPDRFGYLSLHYIASLNAPRLKMVEYRRFAGLGFELQIRSILQHAWAEIEHDLGYKASTALPRQMRRRFSRLAGILELADEEFANLRTSLGSYEEVVSEKIDASPEQLEVDQSTVAALLERDSVMQLDLAVAAMFPAELRDDVDLQFAARRADALRNLEVLDLRELEALVLGWKEHVIDFARVWLSREGAPREPGQKAARGIGLFYLEYALLGAAADSLATKWVNSGMSSASQRRVLLSEVRRAWADVVDRIGAPPTRSLGPSHPE